MKKTLLEKNAVMSITIVNQASKTLQKKNASKVALGFGNWNLARISNSEIWNSEIGRNSCCGTIQILCYDMASTQTGKWKSRNFESTLSSANFAAKSEMRKK